MPCGPFPLGAAAMEVGWPLRRRAGDRLLSSLRDMQAELASLAKRRTVKVVLLSLQKGLFCENEIRSAAFDDGVEFTILPDLTTLLKSDAVFDVAILCCHVLGEENAFLQMRERGLAKFYGAWFWDNHHHQTANLRTAMVADLLFVSHWHERGYLNHPRALAAAHVPLYSRQWSPGAVTHYYPAGLPSERLDGLFGGYGHYAWATARNQFLKSLQAACPAHALSLGRLSAYFEIPPDERLHQWTARKVHLTVPINRDISTRIFEALMTGQIPLVPDDLPDFDRVITPQDQNALPVLRYRANDVDSAKAAWQKGVALFDQAGSDGIQRRYAFARDRHSLASRLVDFAEFLRRPGSFRLASNRNVQFWDRWL